MNSGKLLSRGILACVSISVLLGPWLFGAWEMWWFWPLVLPVFVATLLLSIRLMIKGRSAQGVAPGLGGDRIRAENSVLNPLRLLLLALPFLFYACARFLGATVYIDAERSFLLFLTAWLLGLVVLFGIGEQERRWLFLAICINLLLIGIYGWINHELTGSQLVLWAEGFPNYYEDDRASGSYFCPDHYSGIMEIAVCLGLGLILGGGARMTMRLGGCAMIALGVVGVIMSKSRGGGMTLVVIAIAASIWGLTHLPREARWWWRISSLSFLLMLILLFASLAGPYMERFGDYFGWQTSKGRPVGEALETIRTRTMNHSRPHMYIGAFRAWKTAPWLGIGPGMHESVWPQLATSGDGDPETGKWPTRVNLKWTSNEVHNDWLELLEEYGIIGFLLFLLPFCALMQAFRRGLGQEVRRRRIQQAVHGTASDPLGDATVLGIYLAILAMAFHSLGDFNLQIPATTWVMAALAALGLRAMGTTASVGSDS